MFITFFPTESHANATSKFTMYLKKEGAAVRNELVQLADLIHKLYLISPLAELESMLSRSFTYA